MHFSDCFYKNALLEKTSIIMNAIYYKQQLYNLLSIEYNCPADVFDREDNILTESKLCDGSNNQNAGKPRHPSIVQRDVQKRLSPV